MRRYVGLVARIGFSVLLIGYVIKTTPVDKIWDVFRTVHLGWVFACCPLLMILVSITAYRWRLLLRAQRIDLPFVSALKWTWVGAFFNSVFPGLTGGDVIKAYYASRETTLRAAAATSVFVDRVVGMAALLLIGALGAGLSMGDRTSLSASVLAAGFLFGLIAFFALAFSTRFLSFGQRSVDLFASWPWLAKASRFFDILKKVHESLYRYRSSPWTLGYCIALSVAVHAMVVVLNMFIAHALGCPRVSWTHYALFVPVINTLMIIPVHVGGLGAREALYKHFFSGVGLREEQAVAISLLVYACQLTMNLAGGVVYLFAKAKDPGRIHASLNPEVNE